jgi:hypothetical protein
VRNDGILEEEGTEETEHFRAEKYLQVKLPGI